MYSYIEDHIEDWIKKRLKFGKTTIDQISEIWITLHERAHLELGHFSILDGVPTFNLISKSGKSQVRETNLPRALWDKVERCLELQADHEALEEMLGNISEVDWAELRVTIASIAAVMVLIEKADAENPNPSETHPKAATRIFQLLGHVMICGRLVPR